MGFYLHVYSTFTTLGAYQIQSAHCLFYNRTSKAMIFIMMRLICIASWNGLQSTVVQIDVKHGMNTGASPYLKKMCTAWFFKVHYTMHRSYRFIPHTNG